MEFKPNKSWWLLGVGMLLGAGVAYAADPRYDEADATISKAEALLNAIVVPNENPGAAFQRKKALKALDRAQIRIACAKANQDSGKRGCPAARINRFDDNDDDKDDKDDGKRRHGEHGPGRDGKHNEGKPDPGKDGKQNHGRPDHGRDGKPGSRPPAAAKPKQ
jgi:hypothetical protein